MTNASTKPRPAKIHNTDIDWKDQDAAPTKVRVRRLITRSRHGSELMLGVCEMAPGEETNLWSSTERHDVGADDHWYGPVEETYYCIQGHLSLSWDEGVIDFGPGDAIYLAPGWHYRLKNSGSDPAFFVYSMYPSQE